MAQCHQKFCSNEGLELEKLKIDIEASKLGLRTERVRLLKCLRHRAFSLEWLGQGRFGYDGPIGI